MKKSNNTLVKIIVICICITFAAFLVFSLLEKQAPKEITDITTITADQIGEGYKPYYIEELHIIERYAFMTIDDYTDSEGYSSTSYYPHAADEPMDEYELWEEYYIVMFYDSSGTPHLASLTTRDFEKVSQESSVISACVSATSEPADTTFMNNYDKKILELREESLNAYSAESGIPYEGIRMEYKYETLDEYYENQ